MKAIIDTNILIYDTFEDSVFHERAKILLNELDEWIIPEIVIYEYIWFMKGLDVDVDNVLEKVREYLLHAKGVLTTSNAYDVIKSLESVYSEKLSLSRFNDKLILTIAIKNKIPIATFDMKLRKQALKNNLIILPQELSF